ncbi:MAG: hypothetical protein ACKODH_17855 [Limisphaerales bacterium]
MTTDAIKSHLNVATFKPFVLHLTDGRSLSVKHPDFVAFSPSHREIFLWTAEWTYEFVALNAITSLEVFRRPAGGSARKAGA